MKMILTFFGLLLVTGLAQADWVLDGSQSTLGFVSTKNIDIAESHHFGQLSGFLDAKGYFRVTIALDSVDTAVPIRDERMREVRFDTAHHPQAVAAGQIDMKTLAGLEVGDSIQLEVPFKLALRGQQSEHTVTVEVTCVGSDQLLVNTRAPILINAAAVGLGAGVEKLQEIAGLSAISKAVPVYFNLHFAQNQ